jgi:hypothetical protein
MKRLHGVVISPAVECREDKRRGGVPIIGPPWPTLVHGSRLTSPWPHHWGRAFRPLICRSQEKSKEE